MHNLGLMILIQCSRSCGYVVLYCVRYPCALYKLFLRNILKCQGATRNSIACKQTRRLLSAWIFIFRRYSREKIEGRARALRGIFESAVLFGEGKRAESKNILPKNKTVLDTFGAKSIVILIYFLLPQGKRINKLY